MSKTLHITNGDSLTEQLAGVPVQGNIITWREILCEGKTTTDVGSETFWKTRFDHLKSNYRITKQTFIEKTLKEYRRLCNEKQQDEIVLWFDNDLFCQVNMIAVISWLKKYRKDVQISLVSPKKQFQFFSSLTSEQLDRLYKKRVHLTQDDIATADYVWQLYCSDSPINLENFSSFNSSQFNFLQNAIHTHLSRFPSIHNGLNSVENFVLGEATKRKLKSKDELIVMSLKNQKSFGFGDIQFENVINLLKPLFSTFSPVTLSQKGNDVIDGATNFYSELRDDHIFLGGSRKYDFLFNDSTGKLLKL
ncbi:hypothetical protein NBRC110019_04030 [Neptunitalea chrysea]|uniref:DUF1835 domain-containing protein n=1 Tax=Neptunitalea chrysea TaxID=1647581 RepID=A0A9W6ETN9_9FLAO|nr:DUF1835 domain-containing protein [Neptunitalea chrysea]GLB51364.1 hypothetical protein NBRC110019_04030 [Neptunitalea chrysea]